MDDVWDFRIWLNVRIKWNDGRSKGWGGCRGDCEFWIE